MSRVKQPKIIVGKLHVLLPPHLQPDPKNRIKTWCGRLASDVGWVFAPTKKILARKDICQACKKAIQSGKIPSHANLGGAKRY
jgi:hypothetical protein